MQRWIVVGLCLIVAVVAAVLGRWLVAGFLVVVGGFVLFARPHFGPQTRQPGSIYRRMHK